MGQQIIDAGYSVEIVSFPGQPGNEGVFSVAHSCTIFRKYLERDKRRCVIFGICSGAVAAMSASIGTSGVCGLFCWDVAPKFRYTIENVFWLQKRYGITFCPISSLVPIQASDLASLVTVPLILAFPPDSYYTTAAEQRLLAHRAERGRSLMVHETGHIPGVPRGSERILATVLLKWLRETTDDNSSKPSTGVHQL